MGLRLSPFLPPYFEHDLQYVQIFVCLVCRSWHVLCAELRMYMCRFKYVQISEWFMSRFEYALCAGFSLLYVKPRFARFGLVCVVCSFYFSFVLFCLAHGLNLWTFPPSKPVAPLFCVARADPNKRRGLCQGAIPPLHLLMRCSGSDTDVLCTE